MLRQKLLSSAGIIMALAGASIMFEGGVFGESTTGIATVMGIVGTGLIATSSVRILK